MQEKLTQKYVSAAKKDDNVDDDDDDDGGAGAGCIPVSSVTASLQSRKQDVFLIFVFLPSPCRSGCLLELTCICTAMIMLVCILIHFGMRNDACSDEVCIIVLVKSFQFDLKQQPEVQLLK